ncbi:TPA: rRNA maturation RNase YbeY [Candidatus Galligastranaerophilus faecipullorum]|nr:rRNA maturation RNase YbeY [Candidatus Galligastranaerophilus faecipullorum]
MMNSKIEINTLDKLRLPFKKGDIKKTAQKILSLLVLMPQISSCKTLSRQDFQIISFEISFCTDRLIREINRDYRSKDKATDVITFALFADDENSIIQNDTLELGEIIISIDTLISQAQENGNTIEKELYTLITHGILHLLGFDHLTQKDYDFVVGIQEAIVNNL